MKHTRHAKLYSVLLPVGFIVLTLIIMAIYAPSFYSWVNLRNILDHSAPYILMTMAMTAVIASRGIDLSVGSNVALSGVIIGLLFKHQVPLVLAVFLTMLAGLVMGFINGALITRFDLPPYVITLGTMSFYRGLTLILTKGQTIYGFPKAFAFFGKGSYGKLNFAIIFALSIALIFFVLFPNTKWGQYAMAIGGNETALARTAVNVKAYKISIYMVMGLMASFAGIILTSRVAAADPGIAYMLETDVIAAVILGGTTMRGGQASMIGSFFACLFLFVLRSALTHLSVSAYYHQATTGLILLVSVILAQRKAKRKNH